MTDKTLKPDVAAPGLLKADSKLGTDVANCRVYVHDISVRPKTEQVAFRVSYFWNLQALNAYLADPAADVVRPFLEEDYSFVGLNEDSPLRVQCLDYLLTLPRFATGWIKA